MKSFHDLPIARKFVVVMTASCTLVLLSCAAVLVGITIEQFRIQEIDTLKAISRTLSYNLESALIFDDPDAIRETLDSLQVEPRIVAACVYNRAGKVIQSYDTSASTWEAPSPRAPGWYYQGGYLHLYQNITFEKKKVGILYLRSSQDALDQLTRNFIHSTLIILLVSLGGILLLAGYLQKFITRPVLDLTHLARSITRDRNFDVRGLQKTRDEIGELIRCFNEMLDQIQQQDAKLQQARDHLELRVADRTREASMLNNELKNRIRELEDVNRELETFAYSVSHDLRAPLRHIDGFSQILREQSKNLPREQLQIIETISSSARKMGLLIDALLSFSRTSRVEMNIQTVSLSKLFEEAIALESRGQENRRVICRINSLPEVQGDPVLLQSAITNLVSNAFKYTPPTQDVHIEVTARSTPSHHLIAIQDHGIGFDNQYADKIFGVFQRLNDSQLYEGTGIGLATVRRIIHRHGGSIHAQGQPGSGACFTLYFPRNLHALERAA